MKKKGGATIQQRGDAAELRAKYDYNDSPKQPRDYVVKKKIDNIIHDDNPNERIHEYITNADVNRIRNNWGIRRHPLRWIGRGVCITGKGLYGGSTVTERGEAGEMRERFFFGNLNNPRNVDGRTAYAALSRIIKEPDDRYSAEYPHLDFNWIQGRPEKNTWDDTIVR